MDNWGFQMGIDTSECVTETSRLGNNDTDGRYVNDTRDRDVNSTRDIDVNATGYRDVNDTIDRDVNGTLDRDVNGTRDIDEQRWGNSGAKDDTYTSDTGGQRRDTRGANEDQPGTGEEGVVSRALGGGWGWMVVLGAFLLHTVGNGTERVKGILYLELLNRFNKSSLETTWVLTLSSSIGFLGGPLVSGLCDRLSCRTAGYIGALLTCAGLLLSGFVPSLTYMYITYGILTGIGRSITYASCLISVGLYFDKRIGLAVGLSTAGSGVGSFAFPPLVELLFVTYGFQSAFMMMAAIFSHAFVAASLFRPLRNSVLRRKSIPNLKYEVAVVSIDAYPEINGAMLQDKAKSKTKLQDSCKVRTKKHKCQSPLECQLLRHYVFTATCIQVLFHHMAKQAVFMFLPAFAVSKGISVADAAFLLSAAGICECVSKFVTTVVLDLKPLRRYRLVIYMGVVILMGVVAASIPSLTNFLQFTVASSIYGFLSGTRSQKNIVIIDTLGQEHLSGAMGWMFLFQGLGSIIGPTIAAVYKDYHGDYDMTIYLGAIGHLTGGLVMASGVFHYCVRNSEKHRSSQCTNNNNTC